MTTSRSIPRVIGMAIGCALILLPSSARAVTRTCGPDAVANTTNVLCASPSGPCTATSVVMSTSIDVTTGGCDFDLGGRSLQVQKTFQMIGSGFINIRNAGDITITTTGKLKARGDFVEPNGFIISGGLITLASSGAIVDQGVIDVSGDSAGTIRFTAVGDVSLTSDASVTAFGDTLADEGQRFADGGTFEATSTTGSITINGSIAVAGNNQATGGSVALTAARDIAVNQPIDATGGGSDGGEVDLACGDNIVITKTIDVSSRVGGGFGGIITLIAGADGFGGLATGGALTVNNASLLLTGSPAETSGGDGGELDATSFGPMRFIGANVSVRADAATTFDGDGGGIFLDSSDDNFFRLGALEGNLEVAGILSVHSGNDGGSGGTVEFDAGYDLTVTASIDASGHDSGGDVSGDAGRAVLLAGPIAAAATGATGFGGSIDFDAGEASIASLSLAGDIDASGGSANGSGDAITLSGCGLSVEANVDIDGHAGINAGNIAGGSTIELLSLTPMRLKANTRFLALPAGRILTTHPPGQNPVIDPTATFDPPRFDQATTAGAYSNCPVCGDGIVQGGEGCDDGNLSGGDGCAADCSVETGYECTGAPSACGPLCGDGRVIAPEQCDDGNLASNDGCGPTCIVDLGWTCTGSPSQCTQTCGDGIVAPGEECDDGNLVSGDGCDANCRVTGCGNGIVTAGEGCDDGNLLNGDCCSALCQPEAAGSPCAGDGNVCTDDVCNGGGTCVHPNNTAPCGDDGNACTNDVCAAGICTHPPNTAPCNDGNGCTQTDVCQNGTCVGSNPVVCAAPDQCHVAGTCAPATGLCSNPTKPNGSTCNDGNACTRTDSCQAGTCTGANPVVCTASDQCHAVGTCAPATGVCSNPPKPDGSACADGNACTRTDTCQAGVCSGGNPVVCTPLDQCHAAGTCAPATGQCSNPPVTGQSCNDGNVCTRQDVCTNGTCVGDPHVCGDGVLESSCGELCDDGNLVDGDGCDSNCTPTACGNGILTAGEQCDDGDLADGNGCSSTCTIEPGWTCSGTPSHCTEVCGDGIQTPGEQCDDGNTLSRDGCSSTCRFELCRATPATGCRLPVESHKAGLQLKSKSTSDKDVLTWKWVRGVTTPKATFGQPTFSTDYAICLYDELGGVPHLKISVNAPHGGLCKGRPCWRDLSTGFKYNNASVFPNGKLKVQLKQGLIDGAAKIVVSGKGGHLLLPTLPLDQSQRVRVQLRNSDGACWEADYSTSTANEPGQFKAKAD